MMLPVPAKVPTVNQTLPPEPAPPQTEEVRPLALSVPSTVSVPATASRIAPPPEPPQPPT